MKFSFTRTLKKIAIISDAVYPYNKGGKEKRIFEISTRLAKKGHQVTIYCMHWFKGGNEMVENGVRLKAISPLYPLYSGQRRSIKQAVMFALSTFKLLREDFDIIDADHMPHLVLFPLKIVTVLKRKKLFVTWNEVWGRKYWVEYMGVWGNIAYAIEWVSARLPDEIISISKHTTNKLVNELKVKQQIHTIPLGVDLEFINKVKPTKEKSDVIFAGRLLAHKNVDVLIKSIAILKKDFPKIKAIIVGEGPEKNRLKSLVISLKLEKNIIFYDFFEKHSDLYAYMKSSKVFAFPSTREGFGLVVLEANACGIPFATTDHQDNAARELVENSNNGFAVRWEPEFFAEAISQLLSKKRYNEIDMKKYDWEYILNKIEEIYKL